MDGKSIACKDAPIDAKVAHPIWIYSHKESGEHNDRKCMNGKQLVCMDFKLGNTYADLLIPRVRPAHKYPISPWEMIHLPGGDNAVGR
jgi:hypothetical protein